MGSSCRAGLIGVVATLWLAIAHSPRAEGAGFAITSPDAPPAGLVTTDTVRIDITGPSFAAIQHAILKLNGRDVTSALHPDGSTGSMSGVGGGRVQLRRAASQHGPLRRHASTDQFDMLTPMVNWIENKVAPGAVVASGRNFSATLGTLTGLPTTRSRPLCAYPETLRYVGPAGGDISLAKATMRAEAERIRAAVQPRIAPARANRLHFNRASTPEPDHGGDRSGGVDRLPW